MKTIKEAANALLSRKEITQEEYDLIEKTGGFDITKEAKINYVELAEIAAKKGAKAAEEYAKNKFYSSPIRDFITGPLKTALISGALTGAGIVVGKELVYDPIKSRHDIKKSYNEMAEKVPSLAEKDQNKIQDYFSVVKTFSPKAASNPLVAGALVNKMMEFGGVDHKLVQDISAIESGLVRPSMTGTMSESAVKSIIGIPKE